MASPLETALGELSKIQRKAVEWEQGALLVLAGPGSGKTRVLTSRVARILDQSRDERFRILALTFTNKAAHEMSSRVTGLSPGLEDRADIHTFHGFCAHVLRQHGVHLGIKPNFAIYSRTSDRQAALERAFERNSPQLVREARRLLPRIDALKVQLVRPEQAEEHAADWGGASSEEARQVAQAYRLYEDELRRANALDFNSLIFEAHQLFGYPAMAQHYQTVYRHWLIDEFQDTNGSQYSLLRRMAGKEFRQLFAVADDDQTIYEWNGASVRRIGNFVTDFACEVVQLPTNYRCPPRIVEAANRLVVYNVRRDESKRPAIPARRGSGDRRQIQCRVFETAEGEAAGIAADLAGLDVAERDEAAVLARTRGLLESMRDALEAQGVSSVILVRRDDFVSPEMRWLVACLQQINRPLDRRNMSMLVETFASFAGVRPDFGGIESRSASEEVTYLSVWTDAVRREGVPPAIESAVDAVSRLARGDTRPGRALEEIVAGFENDDSDDDLKDDLSAWRRLSREIKAAHGTSSLDRFLQELELRSKEPVRGHGTVSLATIHSAKGLEFDTVYLIGLAEEILPSWHSVNKGSGSAALEEERRECFVAITRTKQRLILSRARKYRGWPKRPSRFLAEMGFLNQSNDNAVPRERARLDR